jgi:hypothetical protein
MNLWPERKTSVSRRLTAIRSDFETLGDDLRGLVDDLTEVASTRAGRVVTPVAKTLIVVSGRLNGKSLGTRIRSRLPGMSPAALIAGSFGAAAIVGGLLVRR